MNIKDLANLDVKDLQNIDYSALVSELKKRPDVIIEVLSVLITIGLCLYFYTGKGKELKTLSRDLTQLEQKATLYDGLKEAQDALDSFKTALPAKLTESEIIEVITQTAGRYNVKIESFSPAVTVNQSSHSSSTVTLQLKTKNYTDLWKFIKAIESENKTIRIDKWSMHTNNASRPIRSRLRQKANAETDPDMLTLNLTITAINFKK